MQQKYFKTTQQNQNFLLHNLANNKISIKDYENLSWTDPR